ncbi:hypothetical protein M378DRAFT_27914 [Amanita muscaria Koide BX008]|uniref:Uncharacterized protein n=1 Tax=Amanita muscaria (strain Koide BX008) TaxID=946122 RepID=A0A0C2WLM6_AMAMK|nr:hypothetical protein M378DRAFT_27914 [Amanita muscaria Koide BX008]
MPKHPLDGGFSTPTKRPRNERAVPFSAPCLPVRPCDSPSNPFGRKRVQSLARALPPPTPFSKHLPLRFQLVRTDRPSPRLHGGVHRIVQVPTNYTFMHLRCLIAFIFGGSFSMLFREDPHLFEVKRKIELFNVAYKPGQVKAGQTWSKLSSTLDPCRYRPELDKAEFEQGTSSSAAQKGEIFGHVEEEEPGEWKWHAEEDFTLDRAWPKGCDLTRAIIYHHDRTTQIHITINTVPVPKRKGYSNTPFVFSGRGLVALSLPLLIPKPVFSGGQFGKASSGSNSIGNRLHRRILGSASSVRSRSKTRARISDHEQDLTDQDAEGEVDPEASQFSDEDDEDDEGLNHGRDNIHTTLDPKALNEEDAFHRFFSRCQRLARSRVQRGSSGFGVEYDSTSSDDEQTLDRKSASPSTLLSSSATKPPAGYSSPATSLSGSVQPPATKVRNVATPPPQTSSPGPSSPTFHVPFSQPATTSRSTHGFVSSSPGNIFERRNSLSPKKRRHSSLLHHLPFQPSPSGFPKYTPLPARGQLYRMRIKRIEKRVERMKSLEWLKVPDDEDGKTKKKEEAKKVKEKAKLKDSSSQMLHRRAAPGGVLEMGISRGKRVLCRGKTTGTSRQRQEDDSEPEV